VGLALDSYLSEGDIVRAITVEEFKLIPSGENGIVQGGHDHYAQQKLENKLFKVTGVRGVGSSREVVSVVPLAADIYTDKAFYNSLRFRKL
jgi:hypothetical protein